MNRTPFVCLAIGVCALVLLAARGSAWAPPQAVAAQALPAAPRVTSGDVHTRAVQTGLERAVDGIAANTSAAWVGYFVDAIPGDRWIGDEPGTGRCGTVYLEGRRHVATPAAQESAAAPRAMTVLLRVGGGSVQKVRTSPADCDLDAGGLAVHWLTGVDAGESVALLARSVTEGGAGTSAASPWNPTLSALALHATPAATLALERFVAAGQPAAVRKRAAFWLGSTRGASGFATLRRLADADPDDAFRKELPFALSVSGEPDAVGVLIKMARGDANTEVRRQAIFWLGQKAGAKVAGTLADVAASDPETAIKERAVFALSRLPNGEGVEKLIEVARTNRDLAVRKRAIFWLGQSNDPRALDYITTVLTGRK
jgi:HEAT repeat protein